MPTLKIKPPNKYPRSFSLALELGEGGHTLTTGTKPECLLVAKKFRCFLKSLRDYPLHPLQNILQRYDVKTRVEQLPSGQFSLIIHVKQKIDFEAALI